MSTMLFTTTLNNMTNSQRWTVFSLGENCFQGEYGILDQSSGDLNQALKKFAEQFSSYMNCSYGTRSPLEAIPRARISSELKMMVWKAARK